MKTLIYLNKSESTRSKEGRCCLSITALWVEQQFQCSTLTAHRALLLQDSDTDSDSDQEVAGAEPATDTESEPGEADRDTELDAMIIDVLLADKRAKKDRGRGIERKLKENYSTL